MFYLLPCNFLVVNGSVLKIKMSIHWTFTYTQEKLCIDTYQSFVSDVKKRYKPLQLSKKTIYVHQNVVLLKEHVITS